MTQFASQTNMIILMYRYQKLLWVGLQSSMLSSSLLPLKRKKETKTKRIKQLNIFFTYFLRWRYNSLSTTVKSSLWLFSIRILIPVIKIHLEQRAVAIFVQRGRSLAIRPASPDDIVRSLTQVRFQGFFQVVTGRFPLALAVFLRVSIKGIAC